MKHLERLLTDTVGEIARSDSRTLPIFDHYGIDFCCGGKLLLADACRKKHLDFDTVSTELTAVMTAEEVPTDLDAMASWPLTKLADWIVEKHHTYVQTQTLELQRLLSKVSRVHGDQHPELHRIHEVFQLVAGELATHMKKEELILFPWIKRTEAAANGEIAFTPPPFGSLSNPIDMMEAEHETAGDGMEEIRVLTHQYQLPEGACASYWQTYQYLEAFEKDLHIHIHLENNILFPRAIALEATLFHPAQ
jgi:regulator of cell morphogenesis and NO signaling